MPTTILPNREGIVSSDEDDNESLASSIESDHSENHEFPVDRILAEKKEGGSERYLLQWTGYPIERATWEPEENIDVSMLEIWKDRKSREASGLDQPFDVKHYEATVKILREEREARVAQRNLRREAKSKRLETENHAPVQNSSLSKHSRTGKESMTTVSVYIYIPFQLYSTSFC
jgi:hypothetical protein